MRTVIIVAVLVVAALGLTGLALWSTTRGINPKALEAKYMTPEDRFVVVDGARVRVREQGPKDAPPIVLVHGFTFSLESWNAWASELARKHRVIRYDLLGHGLTGPDPERRYSVAARVAFQVKLMNTLGIEKADIAGNSLGGLIAWRIAAEHPERVGRLILIDPGVYSINGVTERPVAPPSPLKAYFLSAPEAGVFAAVASLYGDPKKLDPGRLKVIRDMMRRRGNGAAFIEHVEQFTLPAPDAELGKITAPTLILWGEADRLIPPAQGERMKAAIKDAALIRYPGVGHLPQEEAPAASLADALEFLRVTENPIDLGADAPEAVAP